MLHTILRKFTITALTAIAAIGVAAQTYRLPSAHTAEHKDLIARQENIGNQISVKDTQDFLDNLFKDEAEPELDIYTEGWNSKSVNAYAGMEVPDMQTIDVSNFAMPCPGYVTSPYGYRPRFRREHKGIDLKLQTGDTVYAAFPGRVRLTNFERRGYGHYVILRHPNGLETVYGHLSKILVKPDQDVKVGEPIALGGNTGRSFGSHLHFETRYMGTPINPAAIFDFANQTVHTDTYTFDKDTYKKPRNFDPAANTEYARQYRATHPQKATASSSSGSKGSKSYTIRRGDTLSRIASRNGVTVRQLCRLNGMTTKTKLTPGKKIRLR
ncbi:MAG: peptidoglycan DD-metalloendopeptidase family protein [Muribaculaceae bacterium]|jgi:murein DD-endopeptidase MepM/ murein hydrolase activator NlpD|nr:peptidoglycan DD-metalloendopeptidase family protein [Muribaculaceae bacterium]